MAEYKTIPVSLSLLQRLTHFLYNIPNQPGWQAQQASQRRMEQRLDNTKRLEFLDELHAAIEQGLEMQAAAQAEASTARAWSDAQAEALALAESKAHEPA